MYRSPTCTQIDKITAEYLAAIAGINVEEYAKSMFNAGSNLKEKTAKEIFFQDFKKFVSGDIVFGVGQINSMDKEELLAIKNKLKDYVTKALKVQNVDMIFFMLTNILDQVTEVLCIGKDAKEIVEEAFDVTITNGSVFLPVVSRKKQFIPSVLAVLSEM